MSDPDGELYRGFGLGLGSVTQLVGPSVVACSLRAAAKGHGIGRPVGDPRQMPGLFQVAGDRVLWRHDFAHAGDHPDFESLPARLPGAGGGSDPARAKRKGRRVRKGARSAPGRSGGPAARRRTSGP